MGSYLYAGVDQLSEEDRGGGLEVEEEFSGLEVEEEFSLTVINYPHPPPPFLLLILLFHCVDKWAGAVHCHVVVSQGFTQVLGDENSLESYTRHQLVGPTSSTKK